MPTNSRSEILAYLDRHVTIDKDATSARGRGRKPASTGGRGRASRRTLDLHGMTEDRAVVALRSALQRYCEQGINELLVIHGKGWHSDIAGGPVLKRLVHAMLENELRDKVRRWQPAIPRDGGEGATLVRLR